jgi:ankyrin repeat protein
VDVRAPFRDGDGYFDIARDSNALHVAAWRARHDTVRLLIRSGARVNAEDGKGRTPLQLAVRACIDSYWMSRRSPDSVQALLEAGAAVDGIVYPTGYEEVDALLAAHAGR